MVAVSEREARHIIRNPHICGGEPTVARTRMPVRSVVIQWGHFQSFEGVQRGFPRLDVPVTQAALGFYEAERVEVDRLFEENARAAYAAD